jgi:prepilin-type N-terminal cleavage/methylation domain-containing protein
MKKSLKIRGFTLIELMVAVVAIGIIAAAAAPRFGLAIQRAGFKSETRDIISKLRTARSESITKKLPYGLYFDYDNKTITSFIDVANLPAAVYEEGQDSVLAVDSLPSSYTYLYASFNNYTVVFQSNGSASQSGDIYLMSLDDDHYNFSRLSVLASTGKSSIEYIYNY